MEYIAGGDLARDFHYPDLQLIADYRSLQAEDDQAEPVHQSI